MNQYSITLESIDELDSVVTESAIDVLLSICESADKISDMLNNSATGFYQEAAEPEKKDSVLKTILMLPIKLIQSIIKILTGKDAEKDSKKIKEVSEKLKNEDQSKIKALFNAIAHPSKTGAVVLGGVTIASAAAIVIFRKSIMNGIKNIKESFVHMTKMSPKKINIVFELDDDGHVRSNIKTGALGEFYKDVARILSNVYETANIPSAELSNRILKKWVTTAKIVSYGEEETREMLLEWCRKYDKFYIAINATLLHITNIQDQSAKLNPPKNEKDQVAFNKLLETTLEITKQINKIHNETKKLVEEIEKVLNKADVSESTDEPKKTDQQSADEKEEKEEKPADTGGPNQSKSEKTENVTHEKVAEGETGKNDSKKPEEKHEEPSKSETKSEFETYEADERPGLGATIKGPVVLKGMIPKEEREKYGCSGDAYPIHKIINKKKGKRKVVDVVGKDIIPNIDKLYRVPEPVLVWDTSISKYRCCTYDTKEEYGHNKKLVVKKGKEFEQINPNINDDLETFQQDYFVEKDIDPVVLAWYSK